MSWLFYVYGFCFCLTKICSVRYCLCLIQRVGREEGVKKKSVKEFVYNICSYCLEEFFKPLRERPKIKRMDNYEDNVWKSPFENRV